ncbi:MAG TPA: sigma-70 factor domain-containing protein, partial [Terriglobia bacterium]|nr:sigma-70 factor domain-containing protein [Terriglobia bacterium]
MARMKNYADALEKVIDVAPAEGPSVYDEIADVPPPDMLRGDDDPGAATLDEIGKEVDPGETEEDADLDLSPGQMESNFDPVWLYLRQMATTPLLTRAGEVEVAKRIEHGHLAALKSLSRSPVAISKVIALGQQLRSDPGMIQSVVQFKFDELTDEILEEKLRRTIEIIDEIAQAEKKMNNLGLKLAGLPGNTKKSSLRRARWKFGRARIELSRLVRSVEFSIETKKTLAAAVAATFDDIRPLEEERSRLQRKALRNRKES